METARQRLPQRTTLQWVVGVLSVVVALPVLTGVVDALRQDAMGERLQGLVSPLVLAVLLIALPLLLLRTLRRFWVEASPTEVAVGSGSTERLVMRLTDVTAVRVTRAVVGPGRPQPVLVLTGTDVHGVAREARISGVLHPTLEPLVSYVADEVARRPDLLAEDQRTEFEGLRRHGA